MPPGGVVCVFNIEERLLDAASEQKLQKCLSTAKWSKVERCLRNPYWIGVIRCLDSNCHPRRRLILRSSSLQTQLVREMGRQFEGTDRFPSQGIGITIASRHEFGKLWFSQMILKSLSKNWRALSGRCFNIKLCVQSGPGEVHFESACGCQLQHREGSVIVFTTITFKIQNQAFQPSFPFQKR